METIKAVIFDFDGTLIDSAPDLTHAVNRLMNEVGEAEFKVDTIAGFIGNGIPKLVERAMRARELNMSNHQKLTERFIVFYEEDPYSRTTIFDGVFDVLAALKSRNIKIAICTNKAERAARLIVDALGFSTYVDVLIGGDTTPHLKPHPAPLRASMDKLNVSKDQTLFVGDSPVDAEAAQRTELPFALFTGGYGHGKQDEIESDFRFSSYQEFIKFISRV